LDWLLRKTGRPPERDATRPLQPIRLYSADMVIAAWLDPANERITDILSRRDDLAVLPEGRDADDPDSWLLVNANELLLVVPPPHSSPSELRVHRQREVVQARVGPYIVTGTAHMRPGQAEDPFLRATQPFLPLTDAVIEQPGEPPIRVDVVIANFRHIAELREHEEG
jgi:hypothetical protein